MFQRLTLLIILGLLLGIAAGFLGFVHPALDTFANFRMQFSAALVFVAGFWLVKYGWRLSALAFFVAIAGLHTSFTIAPKMSVTTSGGAYSLLNLNLYYDNKTPEKVFDLIERVDPDILAVSEFSRKWKARMKKLDEKYPHQYYCAEWSIIGGSMIYSRWPMSQKEGYCHNYAALAAKDVIIDGKTITIGNVHLRWPWPASGPSQVDNLKPYLNQLGPDALFAGDFNSTTWTWLVRRFAKYGSLHLETDLGPSWIYRMLPTPMARYVGLSLDNVMTKGNVFIRQAGTLDPVGSDHLPILIRFDLY